MRDQIQKERLYTGIKGDQDSTCWCPIFEFCWAYNSEKQHCHIFSQNELPPKYFILSCPSPIYGLIMSPSLETGNDAIILDVNHVNSDAVPSFVHSPPQKSTSGRRFSRLSKVSTPRNLDPKRNKIRCPEDVARQTFVLIRFLPRAVIARNSKGAY